MKPKISVAMTAYNGERYIKTQMESVRTQTRPADEVVIFDDGSIDDTVSIAEAFIEENNLTNWVLRVNEQNIGFIENFYRAIRETTGDIVFLCDQDDIWHNDKVEKMAALFEAHPKISILNTGFREIDENGDAVPSKPRFNRTNHNLIRGHIRPGAMKKFGFEEILWRNISPGCTAAFTKECRDLFLERFSRLCPHDWELNIFGSLLDGLYFLNEGLTDYRVHGANTLGLIKLDWRARLSMNTDTDKDMGRARNEQERAIAYLEAEWAAGLDPSQKKALTRYHKLTASRLKLMETGRIKYWLAGVLDIGNYLRLMGPQGIVNDLKRVLKHKKGKSEVRG